MPMNPSDKACFEICVACHRCERKGTFAKCATCSGCHDPQERKDPYDIDNKCRCKEGVLQWRHKNGKLIVAQYPHNPFRQGVKTADETQDERDYQAYLKSAREKLNDPHYDPVIYDDNTSTDAWYKQFKGSK